jgi:hypothetical protein
MPGRTTAHHAFCRRKSTDEAEGETHAFAFGDGGVPGGHRDLRQYDDLGGEDTLGRDQTVVASEVLVRQLPEMVIVAR